MSARPFEEFLVQCFIKWVEANIQSGFRYQFKSPNNKNSKILYEAFVKRAECAIQFDGVSLPWINCNGVQLIPVLHGIDVGGFTENYISHLRDKVASRGSKFSSSALLIIHNSMLDTLINSAMDVGALGAIWHPKSIERKLYSLIDKASSNRALSECLLEDQLALIIEEGATVFGFSSLFHSLDDGQLDFKELGLFNDPIILGMGGQISQIRNRLNENRALRDHIELCVEHYGDQLEGSLKEFSQKFIREHFEDKKDWSSLDLEVYLQEIDKNNAQKLQLHNIDVGGAKFFQRSRSQTKAGQKELSLLIQAPNGQQAITLMLDFLGNDLEQEQVKIRHNSKVSKLASISVSRRGGKRSQVTISIPYDGYPTFFSVELKRVNRSEEYKFRCLVVGQDYFYLEEIKNCFRVEPQNDWLTLQLEENRLRIAAEGDGIYLLSEVEELVDCQEYAVIDFEQLANQTELLQFYLYSGGQRLNLNIEGPIAEDGVNVPLLFDQERFGKLLSDEYNAEYNRAKRKIVIDNAENLVVGVRQQLLEFEAHMIDERILYLSDVASETIRLDELSEISQSLHQAFSQLFDYYGQHKTLPSLVAWGPEYCSLVQAVLDAFEEELTAIPHNQVLLPEQKKLLKVGLYYKEGKERISPIHPLVLAYHLELVNQIKEDKDDEGRSSFATLPLVTLERLVASGLMPFVYHNVADFAHVVATKENTFWLEIIPQKQVGLTYVRRLVKDKLVEFTKAYSRLFCSGAGNAIIINAINQAGAEELFLGLFEYFKRYQQEAVYVHINLYDEKLVCNDFDRFADMKSYEQLKEWLGLNSGAHRADADMLIDLIRSRLTYSKFVSHKDEELAYAHLAFFSNTAPVDCRQVKIEEILSGVLCNGLIAGEAAEIKGDAFFTAFGLRNVEFEPYQPLRLARMLGALWQPACQSNAIYLGTGIGLGVSADFKKLLTRSYDSALWTTIIDPKVTLDFFTSQKDVVLIHYSDQYTSSAGYDAITVTRQVDLFQRLLHKDSNISKDKLLAEFNAFNGEWLLKMLTATPKERKEKHGIIGAYKFVSAMLRHSDICWIPMSVAEMIRVSGNVGLKMSESEFSRHLQGYRKGAISDDVLFVGFKGETLYLLPLEVKTGARPDYSYASQQARELQRYLQEDVLGPRTLACRIYRGLFIRQVLAQLEKFRLYEVLADKSLDALLNRREWWLKGDYQVSSVPDYYNGMVLAHVDSDSCFEPDYRVTENNILQIELPYSLLPTLIATDSNEKFDQLLEDYKVPKEYLPLEKGQDTAPVLSESSHEVEAAPQLVSMPNFLKQDSQVSAGGALATSSGPLQVLFGHDVLRQTPLYWEPTNTAKVMNTNTGIIGTMGTGKTQFTKSLITQLVRNQHCNVSGAPIGMLIFDYKSDYVDRDFVTANQAKVLKLYRLPYNPLSLYGDMPMLPVHTATGFSETLAKAFGLGPKQQLKLRKLILDTYEHVGISKTNATTWQRPAPTIAQVWDLFLGQDKVEEDSLYAALDSLATYEIFETSSENVTSLYDLIDGVTVIELAGYSPQVQNLVVALTLDQFYAQMQKCGKPQIQGDYRQITKMILVDEADNFMKQDFSSLRKILKEGREYGVGFVLSTQEITHFKTSENNYASYVLTWVIHRVAEIKSNDIKAIFNKDDKVQHEQLMEVIRKLEKHNSLYIDGEKNFKKIRDKAFWELA